MSEKYDIAILGGGPGGYVAAIRASQLGLKVALVENDKLGGTCLHSGCIPSKALLRSAEVFRQTKDAATFGIKVAEPTIDFTQVQSRKDGIIQGLYSGVQGLMKKGEIDVYHGFGRLLGPSIFSPLAGTVSVEYENGEENTMIVPKNVLLATGSRPRHLDHLQVDGKQIMTSEEALNLEVLPNSIMIVGGGVIGVEWASMLADFGVKVTLFETAPHILPTEDEDIAKEVERQLKKKGVDVHTSALVEDSTIEDKTTVLLDVTLGEELKQFKAEKVLVSVGRVANIDTIGLNNTDVVVEHGSIQTNEFFQTKESHIYAIGDIIGKKQLAHVASREGVIAVEHMANLAPQKLDYNQIPTCIYSNPEVASVGYTEKAANEAGFEIEVGTFPFQANGKALVYGQAEGFTKIIANKENNDILGIHMVGPHVTELISEAGLAMVLDATPWELTQTVHPHPSLSEAVGEAALAVTNEQIHG